MAGEIRFEEDEERKMTDQLTSHLVGQHEIGRELLGSPLKLIRTNADIPLFGSGDLKGTRLELQFDTPNDTYKTLVIEGNFTSVRID